MQRIIGLLILGLGGLGLILLPGCTTSSGYRAPVVNLKNKTKNLQGYIIVGSNETLFTIAKRSGHNAQTLAIVNGLQPPYVIRPGQKLYVEQPSHSASASRPQSSLNLASRVVASSTSISNKNSGHSSPPIKTTTPPSTTFLLTSPGSRAEPQLASNEEPIVNTEQSRAPTLSTPSSRPNSIRWSWPVQGSIIRTFHSKGKGKGIDITNTGGTIIKAAAPGVVVYSGNGLKGYGNLIIIKHNEDFLSAYAHNRELRVKEGEQVCPGQAIATMGQSGAECVKLHFEIRYKGKPVDPMKFLPKG